MFIIMGRETARNLVLNLAPQGTN